MVYESIILFGIIFTTGYLFGTLTQQRSGLTHHNLLTALLILIVGIYFVWCWSHGGQTLPMKTWRIRVVDTALRPLTIPRALLRYALCWLWFLPPLALHTVLGSSVPHTLLFSRLLDHPVGRCAALRRATPIPARPAGRHPPGRPARGATAG